MSEETSEIEPSVNEEGLVEEINDDSSETSGCAGVGCIIFVIIFAILVFTSSTFAIMALLSGFLIFEFFPLLCCGLLAVGLWIVFFKSFKENETACTKIMVFLVCVAATSFAFWVYYRFYQ